MERKDARALPTPSQKQRHPLGSTVCTEITAQRRRDIRTDNVLHVSDKTPGVTVASRFCTQRCRLKERGANCATMQRALKTRFTCVYYYLSGCCAFVLQFPQMRVKKVKFSFKISGDFDLVVKIRFDFFILRSLPSLDTVLSLLALSGNICLVK